MSVAAQAEGKEGAQLGGVLALAHPGTHGLEPAAPSLAQAATEDAGHEVVHLRDRVRVRVRNEVVDLREALGLGFRLGFGLGFGLGLGLGFGLGFGLGLGLGLGLGSRSRPWPRRP